MAIGLSNDGKWVFNKACTMPWCHTVVPFKVKNDPFLNHVSGRSSSPWRHICKASGLSSTVISNALRKTRTQLGPSSSLDYLEGVCTLPQCNIYPQGGGYTTPVECLSTMGVCTTSAGYLSRGRGAHHLRGVFLERGGVHHLSGIFIQKAGVHHLSGIFIQRGCVHHLGAMFIYRVGGTPPHTNISSEGGVHRLIGIFIQRGGVHHLSGIFFQRAWVHHLSAMFIHRGRVYTTSVEYLCRGGCTPPASNIFPDGGCTPP